MKELLRKKYTLELELKDGRAVNFVIEQGTLRELLEMSKAIEDDSRLKKWLVDFLIAKKPEDAKIEPDDFEFLMPKRVVEIINWLTKTYAAGFFTPKKKGKDDQKEKVKAPDSSIICFILKETGETLESLLNLTWEQIEYLIDGSIWNQNAQTKEGQKRNEREQRMKSIRESWDDETAKEMARKMMERLDKGDVKFKQSSWRKHKTR